MLFHSQEFVLLFLPVAVGIYYALARHPSARQWWLIAASLVFYGWWDIRFLPLLIGQTLVTWLIVELAIRKDWRWLLYFAIVANLSVLGLFKISRFGGDHPGGGNRPRIPKGLADPADRHQLLHFRADILSR